MTVDDLITFLIEVSEKGFGKEKVIVCKESECKCNSQRVFKYNDINGTAKVTLCPDCIQSY